MKLRLVIISTLVIVFALGLCLTNFSSSANAACSSSQDCSQQGAEVLDNGGGFSVNSFIKLILNILSWIAGIASVFMVIFSGFRYVTSGGDSNAVNSARGTLIYALIGIAIVILSQLIIHVVLAHVLKAVKS